ncbi:MAG: class I SAM-dependent methyltransferase [Anaerolineales bacterium]
MSHNPLQKGITDYLYPDISDALTYKLIAQNSPYPDYWYQSELFVLKIVRQQIIDRFKGNHISLLDAGCGFGRLVPEFHDLFNEITAIEPDEVRFKYAKKLIDKQGIYEKVRYFNVSIEQFKPDHTYDVILCSHVIQHVHTNVYLTILGKLISMLSEGGLLVILTNHSRSSADYFVKGSTEKGRYIETRISESQFNSLTQNNEGILPIRFFSMNGLKKTLSMLEAPVIKTRNFHILGNYYGLDKIIFRDRLVNGIPWLKTKVGRDMMLLAAKL